ncbi:MULTISPECIES: acetyl-CoA C-acyltransferase [Deefgea]|uniref:acetyl-CoA C-acyltransferase n=1 Tax=Deefgea chitinilytica TaxID=570276 RepID=A0ABS2C8I6_9NEIS|nr:MULTISPECIES: acetyl-CoA C-acyltransferase [Deefgea]MBM5570463.1 acetyl-CoA C-acyltransferase [Deefgea chitinilytica]MBM9887692.1 acetyl-CoA C-acyltransferase [Deefgea sp. CFH1-16]
MSKQIQEAYIVAAVRTPVGKAPRGMMKGVRPDDLLAHVLKAAMAQVPNLDPALVADVVAGCAMPEGEQGMNVARIGALLAGLPNTVGGITINRFCSSGINAVSLAADKIRLGEADVMIAAGTESMSMVPMGGNKLSLGASIYETDENVAIAYGMGLTAEKVAQQWQVSREDQDAFAVESHRRALAATAAGKFTAEIAPLDVTYRIPNLATGEVELVNKTLLQDEGPRADTSAEGLAKLKTVFAAKGSVTAGNSSQMSDGAAALILVSEKILKEFNLTPLAKYVTFAVKGVPPEIMGIGPKEAIPAALKQAGLNLADLAWIELNEAFAAQALAVSRDLNLDMSIVNPHGGAIALGHPLGATGAIRAATAIHGLRGEGKSGYAMVTMCIGTGMGAAGILQVL